MALDGMDILMILTNTSNPRTHDIFLFVTFLIYFINVLQFLVYGLSILWLNLLI